MLRGLRARGPRSRARAAQRQMDELRLRQQEALAAVMKAEQELQQKEHEASRSRRELADSEAAKARAAGEADFAAKSVAGDDYAAQLAEGLQRECHARARTHTRCASAPGGDAAACCVQATAMPWSTTFWGSPWPLTSATRSLALSVLLSAPGAVAAASRAFARRCNDVLSPSLAPSLTSSRARLPLGTPQMLIMQRDGLLKESELAGGKSGKNMRYSMSSVRGDVVRFVEGTEDEGCYNIGVSVLSLLWMLYCVPHV